MFGPGVALDYDVSRQRTLPGNSAWAGWLADFSVHGGREEIESAAQDFDNSEGVQAQLGLGLHRAHVA